MIFFYIMDININEAINDIDIMHEATELEVFEFVADVALEAFNVTDDCEGFFAA